MQYGFAQDTERPLLAGADHAARFEYDDDSLYGADMSSGDVKSCRRLGVVQIAFCRI